MTGPRPPLSQNPGEFTGRGPRGYQRSDERIKEEVCERLTRHGQVDASDVEVRVEAGEVTVQGSVPTRARSGWSIPGGAVTGTYIAKTPIETHPRSKDSTVRNGRR
jgi:hypothetical protein